MSKILEKGTTIKFKSISEFTGKEIQLTGKVVGDDEAVRKRWPEEMAEALGCHLVATMDNFGNINHHAVFDAEIISIIKKEILDSQKEENEDEEFENLDKQQESMEKVLKEDQ